MDTVCCVMTEKRNVKKVKVILESYNMLHKEFRITEINSEHGNEHLMVIPVSFQHVDNPDVNECVEKATSNATEHMREIPIELVDLGTVTFIEKERLAKSRVVTPQQKLYNYCSTYMDKQNYRITDDEKVGIIVDIPTKWEIHGDLVMFNRRSFNSPFWESFDNTQQFWKGIADILGVERVALSSRIVNDAYRTPFVEIVYGLNNNNGGLVEHVDNGIKYTYDVTRNMFSKGNITEKLRISKWDCHDQVVVDMFAGIGYFVLPYLLKAHAKKIYACEWNPDAIRALKKTLKLNNVPSERYQILEGDNRQIAPVNVADHVNLGLVPTSSASWLASCKALRADHGGWLHIHENIDSGPNIVGNCTCTGTCIVRMKYKDNISKEKGVVWCAFIARALNTLNQHFQTFSNEFWTLTLEHLEHVKSYAPRVDHVVLDVLCRPVKTSEDSI